MPALTCLSQPAGYRSIALTDSSRRYDPSAHPGDPLYNRPIEIDCWYPATSPTATPIRFGEFLRLFEQRANRFQQDTSYTGLAAETAQYLCAGLGIKDTAKLTNSPTHSYRNAPALAKPAPLILYLCSYNGMCYENIPLFETLAAHGYIIASITSVGRYPGNMTTDSADLLEQVADAAFALRYFHQAGLTDTGKPGLIGYSWGGLAILRLAQQTPAAAILSLDGSERHIASILRPESPHTPYAYLESDEQNDHPADSTFVPRPTNYWRYPGSTHEDFSGLPTLATHTNPPWLPLAVSWFDHYIKGAPATFPPNSVYPVVKIQTTFEAKIIDEEGTPLAYLNVGIPGKNLGTVTGGDGSFSLTIDPQLTGDSLLISGVGYEPKTLPLKRIPKTITLRRHTKTLTEAIVTAKSSKTRTLGNKTTSRFMSVGFPLRFLGAEIGIRIHLGKHPVRLKSFHCTVSDSRVDTALFRLNIYSLQTGALQNMLQQNIFLPVGKRTGDYSVDLTGQHLTLNGDILVSLELIRGSFTANATPGALFFSASLLHSATWRRQTSQAEWKKAGAIGVGFNIEVQ